MKCSIAVIQEQSIVTEAADPEISEAILVHIARRNPRAVVVILQFCVARDFRKDTLQVSHHDIGPCAAVGRRITAALSKIDVWPTVQVVIQDPDSTPERLVDGDDSP